MTMRVQPAAPNSNDWAVWYDEHTEGDWFMAASRIFDNQEEAVAWARERDTDVLVQNEEGQLMPWTPKDAQKHTKKASTPKKQRQWSDVSNSAMKRGLSEGAAIREANAVVGRTAKKKTAKKGK